MYVSLKTTRGGKIIVENLKEQKTNKIRANGKRS